MAELIYKGKVAFSDLAPGLAEAASSLSERANEVEEFLSDKQKSVEALQKKAEAVQAELTRAQQAASSAQDILNSANGILEEAKSLVNNIAEALGTSGIYHYNYVGRIDGMGIEVGSEFGNGLPDRDGHPDDSVAAILLVVGGDGGTMATVNKIQGLFSQIGNNAQDIINLYTAD